MRPFISEISEIPARSALIKSRVPGADYAVNPYAGCGHACLYCYMRVIGRDRAAGRGPWGSFVDVRVNTPRLLLKELPRRARGRVMMSTGTDAYQPLEAHYQLTRACLELLGLARFPVSILTKSALILRDLDILISIDDLRVGITITTDDDAIRRAFEPGASSIPERLDALRVLHQAGLHPHVFVGPLLPLDPERLAEAVAPFASHVYLDRMNYPGLVAGPLRARDWRHILDPDHLERVAEIFREELGAEKVEAVCG